jgi:hypothetical protein
MQGDTDRLLDQGIEDKTVIEISSSDLMKVFS